MGFAGSQSMNIRAARIGPTVCELDGPMPMVNRSVTLIAVAVSMRLFVTLNNLSTRGRSRFAVQAWKWHQATRASG